MKDHTNRPPLQHNRQPIITAVDKPIKPDDLQDPNGDDQELRKQLDGQKKQPDTRSKFDRYNDIEEAIIEEETIAT